MKLPKPSFSKRKKSTDSEEFIALDLSTNSVKALHFIKSGDTSFSVDGVSLRRNPIKITKDDVKNAFQECQAQSQSTTKEILLGLSGSGVIGFIMIAKLNRKNVDDPISESEVEDLYNRVRNSADTQAIRKMEVISPKLTELIPLDVVVTTTKVDDAIVEEPIGMKGEHIQVSVFCSYAQKDYYKWAVEQIYALKGNLIAVTTDLYAQTRIINEKSSNYLLIDIGADYTDVALVFGKDIIQTKSFDLGGEYFTSYLAANAGYDLKTAEGKKESFTMHTLPDDEVDEVGDKLYEAGKVWRTALAGVLSSMHGIKSFPYDIYISGGGGQLPIIEEFLYEDDWCKEIPFSQKVEIHKANESLWKNNINDKLNLLTGTQFFIPVSVGLISSELSDG